MNTPAQCGVIKPPKTDIYSEAPQSAAPANDEPTAAPPTEPASPAPTTTAPDTAKPTPTEPTSTTDLAPAIAETAPADDEPSPSAPTEAATSAPTNTAPTLPPQNEPELNATASTPVDPEPIPNPPTGSEPDATESTPPVVQVLRQEPPSLERAIEIATRLAPDIVLPNDCEPPPLGDPTLLPNAAREYRSGIHQGVDFMCPARGRAAVAALDGHVVVAVGDFENPSPTDLDDVLATAAELRATPPYTLVMLYGNYVVLDHGIIDGVGHVVSIYAHLEALDPAIRIGRPVEASQQLGRVGSSGTNMAVAGALDWSLHLHWELHVDNQFLGAGLSASETRSVYTALFGGTTD